MPEVEGSCAIPASKVSQAGQRGHQTVPAVRAMGRWAALGSPFTPRARRGQGCLCVSQGLAVGHTGGAGGCRVPYRCLER